MFEQNIELAKNWLLNSGIQNVKDIRNSEGINLKGSFNSWFDLDKKIYPYAYSETTGYAITTLLFLHNILKDNRLIRKAEKAAKWVIESSMHPCGGVRTRLYKDDDSANTLYSFSGDKIFSFDTGMVLYGMVNLCKLTQNSRYLQASEMLAKFLIDKMQNKDGSLPAIYDPKTDRIIDSLDKWSSQPGSFHAKVSLGLVDLFEITQNDKYQDAAIKLCEYAVSTQKESGRFVTDKASQTTHTHPHCYAAEGLLHTGASFNITEFVESAERATAWTFENVSSEGINELYNPSTGRFNDFQRSDILAQVLRLGILFSFNYKIDTLQSILLEYQYLGEETKQQGGFLYSKTGQDVNSWCTMFAIQALALTEHKDLVSEDKKVSLFV